MSSRQLRKLQKQRELEAAQEAEIRESDEESDDEAQPAPPSRTKPNLFAALGGEDDDADAEADEDDEEESTREPEPAPAPVASAKKSKKKKKKNKKKAAAAAAAAAAAEEEADSDEDEIDKAIKELKITDTQRGTPAVDEDKQRRQAASHSLLQINPYHLKAIHEMRNLFGREVIESANAEEEQQQQQNRRGRRRQIPQQVDLETFLREQGPHAKKLPEVSLRRNMFIQGRDYWPAQSAGGLTMKEVRKGEDGGTEYAYLHEGEYDQLQMIFFSFVQMGDPMRMVHLLKRFRKYKLYNPILRMREV